MFLEHVHKKKFAPDPMAFRWWEHTFFYFFFGSRKKKIMF